MGDSLGFRPPQFSQDLAWLPGWLQQHQTEPLDEHIKEPQTHFEDLAFFQGNFSESKDVNPLSKEEGRYNSCHLFLSGEDNSPISFASSPGNVLHFRLHLSSDGNSQCGPTQLLDASQKLLESNKVLSMQLVENSVGSRERTCSKMDRSANGPSFLHLNSIPETVENLGPPSSSNDKDSERQCEGKFNVRFLKGADVNEAIELSIAASEALVIHELVKSGSALEALPIASVLEVALQVKQARLKGLEDDFHCPIEKTDTCDSLSDMDDFSMADAFEDVGLSYIVPDDQHVCDSAISHVKDTLSENPYLCDNGLNNADLKSQQVNFDDISTQKHLEDNVDTNMLLTKDLCLESERQKKLVGDPRFDSTAFDMARHADPMLHLSVQENLDGLSRTQVVGIAMVDINTVQPQTNAVSSPHAWNSGNAKGKESQTCLVPDRFRSRWLGGWTGRKEVDTSALLKQNNAINVPKCFPRETSFLSESADIAPDENSFLQKHEPKSTLGSQSSICFEGLPEKANEGIFLSQDVVRSSSLSLVDPLCSVVPCSISTENASSTLAQNDTERCFGPTPELGSENLQSTLGKNIEFDNGGEQAMHTDDGEGYRVAARRQLTSLKAYSMLLFDHAPLSESRCLYNNQSFQLEHDQGLLSYDQNMGCTRSSDRRESKEFLPLRSASKYTADRHNKGNDETTINWNSVAEMTKRKKSNDEIAVDGGEFVVQPLEERSSPLLLNCRTRRRLQASKLFVNNFSGEKHPKHAAVPETTVKRQESKSLQKLQSACHNSHGKDISLRKRVRFAETENLLQQTKNHQKLQSSYQNCSNIRASKRQRYSKPWGSSRAYGMKNCPTNFCGKVGKRWIFQGMEFLLTGFSSKKENEIEGLIRKYGGMVLFDIPSPPNSRGKRSSRSICQQFPVILCLEKLETTKFLYGCAVNAFILKVDWLTDSIASGSILTPGKFMILSNGADESTRLGKQPVRRNNQKYIFERVGIMLHGKHSFCTKLAKIFKHGGGQVFKTLKWLVQSLDNEKISMGAIVAEDENRASRHLKHCASEEEIPVMPASWIIKSLHSGKLLPISEKNHSSPLPRDNIPEDPISMELSEEI